MFLPFFCLANIYRPGVHIRSWCCNAATPWTNTNDSCWNETRSCQDAAFWYRTRNHEWSFWELEQNKNEFLFWPPRPRIFRIARGYLLHSLISPHSLTRRIFKDFGTQITNTAVFAKIFIFQKWVLFPTWPEAWNIQACKMSCRHSSIHVMPLTRKNILESSRIFLSVAQCLHDQQAYSMCN